MNCKKCGNTTLLREISYGNGITARPCLLCGEQNYAFPPGCRQKTGGVELWDQVCSVCGLEFTTEYKCTRKYCDDCGPFARVALRKRSPKQKALNFRRRSK